jgi:hypothetical protein
LFSDHRRWCRLDWLFGRRGCRSGGCFSIGDRFLTRLESGLVLREALLLGFHALGSDTILNLALYLRPSFLFGLLFLAGNEKGQGSDQRENGKLLHDVIRQGWCRVIRWNDGSIRRRRRSGRRRGNRNDGDLLDFVAPRFLHVRVDRH